MIKEAKEVTNNGNVNQHQIVVNIAKAPPSEVNPGIFITLKVRVSCSSACNLKSEIVKILDQDGLVVKEARLVISIGAAYETDPVVVKAPITPGQYTWTAVFPEQEKEGVLHAEVSVPFTFTVKLHHATSMAVWDAASPAVVNAKFKLKVGVRCSADCKLTNREIEIYDQEGCKAATEKLGEVPWPGTAALYWAEVELKTPDIEGSYTWQAKFPKPDIDIPHLETCTSFGFVVVNPPDCTLTVEVIDKETRSPISNASISLHPYRTKTDENGRARLDVAKGEYQLYVTGADYEMFKKNIIITDNLNIESELAAAPVMLEDA